jgi:uncharacterized membrane protein
MPTPKKKTNGINEALGLERIAFFSDAVMAIAITLLAVDLRVPEIAHDLAAQQLPLELGRMLPKFVSFVLSFTIIGVYWFSHHRNFGYLRRYDTRLILLNLLFLLWVAFLPFVSDLLGRFGDLPLPNVLYALDASALGLTTGAMWSYAVRGNRLVDADFEPAAARSMSWRVSLASLVFLASIPLAYVSALAMQLSWFAAPLLGFIFNRLGRRKSIQK